MKKQSFWMSPVLILVLCIGLLGIQACSKTPASSSSEQADPATIQIRDIIKQTSGSVPTIKATYKNAGGVTAFDITCTVNAKSSGSVIASVAADITTELPSGDLETGELSILSATLTGVGSHSSYSELTFDFAWKESRSQNGSSESIRVPAAAIQED